MAGAGKKTFTAGETLTASDVNTYLMEQSVMVFGGTAARASAIPTPSTGMTTYIGTTGTATIPQLETYTGSQWQTPYGLTQVANVTFTAASTISVNNVFTSTYQNYKIIFVTDTSTTSAINMRLRASGTDNTSSTYSRMGAIYYYTTVGVLTNDPYMNTTSFQIIPDVSTHAFGQIELSDPFTTANTYGTIHTMRSNNTLGVNGVMAHATSASYDGFTMLTATGTFSGTIRVYGYRNS